MSCVYFRALQQQIHGFMLRTCQTHVLSSFVADFFLKFIIGTELTLEWYSSVWTLMCSSSLDGAGHSLLHIQHTNMGLEPTACTLSSPFLSSGHWNIRFLHYILLHVRNILHNTYTKIFCLILAGTINGEGDIIIV